VAVAERLTPKPKDGQTFDPTLLPKTSPVPPQTLAELQQLEFQLAEKDTKLTELLTGKAVLDAELERLRAEIAAIKKQNEATPDTHNYSEPNWWGSSTTFGPQQERVKATTVLLQLAVFNRATCPQIDDPKHCRRIRPQEIIVVPGGGVEPPRAEARRILSTQAGSEPF
jgi:hypothetical protein